MAQKVFQYIISQDGTTKIHEEAEKELNALLLSGYRLTNVTTVPFAKKDNSSECLLVINILEDTINNSNNNNNNVIGAQANNPANSNSLDWLKGVDPNVLKTLLNVARSPTN